MGDKAGVPCSFHLLFWRFIFIVCVIVLLVQIYVCHMSSAPGVQKKCARSPVSGVTGDCEL